MYTYTINIRIRTHALFLLKPRKKKLELKCRNVISFLDFKTGREEPKMSFFITHV